MTVKPKISKNSTPANANLGCMYSTPADWARELFKPSKDEESLVVRNEKKIFWMPVFLFIFVWWECVYAYFIYIQMMSSGPGRQR